MSGRGQDFRIYTADAYSSPTFTEIAGVDDLDFDAGFETVTFQSRDRDYKESKRGQGDPAITFTLNVGDNSGFTPGIEAGTSFVCGISPTDISEVGTHKVFLMHALVTSYSLAGEIGGVAQYNVTVKPDANQGGATGEPPGWITETTS